MCISHRPLTGDMALALEGARLPVWRPQLQRGRKGGGWVEKEGGVGNNIPSPQRKHKFGNLKIIFPKFQKKASQVPFFDVFFSGKDE